jgi:hypothetical protein
LFQRKVSRSYEQTDEHRPGLDYGLGWFLRQWNGHKVVEHGGNIDGFNAQVALMPGSEARLRVVDERHGVAAWRVCDEHDLEEHRRRSEGE